MSIASKKKYGVAEKIAKTVENNCFRGIGIECREEVYQDTGVSPKP